MSLLQPQGVNVNSIPDAQPQQLRLVIERLETILGKVIDNRNRVENAIGHYFGAEPKPEEQEVIAKQQDFIAAQMSHLLDSITKAADQTSYSCDRLDTIF